MQMIYIFDIDNTLYRASTVRTFLPVAFRKGVLPLKIFLSLPWHFPYFFIRGIGPKMKGRKIWALKGIREKKMKDLAERIYQDKIKPGLNNSILYEIKKARNAGHRIVLATSSFFPIIEPLAREIAPDAVIATDIEFRNGRSTGILRTLPPYREGKKMRVMEYLESAGAVSGAYPPLAPFCLLFFLLMLTLSGNVAFSAVLTAFFLPILYYLMSHYACLQYDPVIMGFFIVAFLLTLALIRKKIVQYLRGEADLFTGIMIFRKRKGNDGKK